MGFHNQEEGFKLQTWGCVFLTCCWGVDGVNTERVIIVVMWMLHIGLPCKVTHLLTKWGALDDVLLRYHSSTKRDLPWVEVNRMGASWEHRRINRSTMGPDGDLQCTIYT